MHAYCNGEKYDDDQSDCEGSNPSICSKCNPLHGIDLPRITMLQFITQRIHRCSNTEEVQNTIASEGGYHQGTELYESVQDDVRYYRRGCNLNRLRGKATQ